MTAAYRVPEPEPRVAEPFVAEPLVAEPLVSEPREPDPEGERVANPPDSPIRLSNRSICADG